MHATAGWGAIMAAGWLAGCTFANAVDVCDRAVPVERGTNALVEGDQAITLDRASAAWAPGRAYLAFSSTTPSGFALRTAFVGAEGAPIAVCGNDAEAELTTTSISARVAVAAPAAASQAGLIAYVDQGSGGNQRVFAQYVRSDGCLVNTPIPVGQEALDESVTEAPTIVALGDSLFAVLWTAVRFAGGLPVESTVRGRLLRGSEALGHIEFPGNARSLAGDVADLMPVAFKPRSVTATSLGGGRIALLWYEIGALNVTIAFAVMNSRLELELALEIFNTEEGGLRVPEPPQPSLAFDGTQLLATWVMEDEGGGTVVFGRFLTPAGQALRSEDAPDGGSFRLHADANGDQRAPSVVALARGGFFVAFEEEGIDGDGSGIAGAVFAPDGRRQFVNLACGREVFVINTLTAGDQSTPATDELDDGTVLVSFTDGSRTGRDASGTGVVTIGLPPSALFPAGE